MDSGAKPKIRDVRAAFLADQLTVLEALDQLKATGLPCEDCKTLVDFWGDIIEQKRNQ